MASFKLVYYLFTLISFINFVTNKAQDDLGFMDYFCSENLTTPNSPFQSNVRSLLSDLSSHATANNNPYYNTTVATTNHSHTAYGMFFCSGDVPPRHCTQCVANATQQILSLSYSHPNCSLSTDAYLKYDDCMIRFSNRSFFSTVDITQLGGSSCSGFNEENLTSLVSKTMKEAADKAAISPIGVKKYATKQARVYGFKTLYCEAQCTPDLSPQDCKKCLNVAQENCQGYFLPRTGLLSCKMGCDWYPFYRPSTAAAPTQPVPLTNPSNTDSQHSTYLSKNCSTIIITDPTFQSSLIALLSYFSSNSTTTKNGFFETKVHTLTGFFMCFGDFSPTLCHQCVLNATQTISSQCPSSKEAIIWYNHCLLHYSDRPSLSALDKSPAYKHLNIVNYTSNPNQLQSFFTWTFAKTLYPLQYDTDGSSSTIKNYAKKQVKLNDRQTLHILVQCTPDQHNSDCRSCIENIFNNEIPWCCMEIPEGRVLYPKCYMMFGLSPFDGYTPQIQELRPATGNNTGWARTIILIGIGVLIVASTTLLSFWCYLRRTKTRKNNYKILLRKNFGEESTIVEGLQYDLTTIKAATNNFSHENKIGKGGFGEVYKGILDDGQHIAVKRLSTHSKQGSIEFVNEVLLIAKLQHKNLVALIGFCLEEQEKILIYEFMPNGSLDYLLYGIQQQKLSWSERYKIIEGTALGILYLHEYSRLKVIHRDLKPSNILLDKNMNPKISDFGMARIVEIDQDRGNTNRIVGTYGYMSPEYAMLGEFSEKSDVFSFGVMILEIITGKKNVQFYDSHTLMEGLIAYVWRQWKNKDLLSILDSHIKEIYSQEEVFQCIHIGLLCVQENPNIRPTMATIISYLNNYSLELPFPQKPSFFLSNHRMDQDTTRQQESSSNQTTNDFKLFSINEMSMSNIYPR
ncbi:putative cysteine-rich receptor-like protein kinase 20 isoform X1 [Cajanus cajan]|uniref:putative cysteine-rich receptor-like protein kinase 20 isoform X1 n=2 Tax=Cajanus cajan TaxID=3821 RepID=UPI0010FB7A46|nr:putative cysteine-rich receptor-like protein kinase 20 isoform X1 [Cajanus cajan]